MFTEPVDWAGICRLVGKCSSANVEVIAKVTGLFNGLSSVTVCGTVCRTGELSWIVRMLAGRPARNRIS